MTDEQQSKVAELKSAIAASGPASGGAPLKVRTAVLVLKEELRRVGTPARELAKGMGLTRRRCAGGSRSAMRTVSRRSWRARRPSGGAEGAALGFAWCESRRRTGGRRGLRRWR
jgi:hypothetical protein